MATFGVAQAVAGPLPAVEPLVPRISPRFVLSRATYPHPRVKIATRARPTYLPSPSRRAWSPGPTHLPLATLEKGCNISATKAWVSEGPSSIVGFSGDRSCPFMSIFCLENRILCLDGLDIFSELQGSSGSQRSMRNIADACRKHGCLHFFGLGPTYLPSALIARVDLPSMKKNETLLWCCRGLVR